MSRKQFATICILLAVIIVLLMVIICQIEQFHTDFLNTSNFLAELLHVLTGKFNSLVP
nr:hypothetical protein [uncultured Oscillibacter sp.]